MLIKNITRTQQISVSEHTDSFGVLLSSYAKKSGEYLHPSVANAFLIMCLTTREMAALRNNRMLVGRRHEPDRQGLSIQVVL
jgi:hypothetical protein